MTDNRGLSAISINLLAFHHKSRSLIGDLVSKEAVCCVGGKVKH